MNYLKAVQASQTTDADKIMAYFKSASALTCQPLFKHQIGLLRRSVLPKQL